MATTCTESFYYHYYLSFNRSNNCEKNVIVDFFSAGLGGEKKPEYTLLIATHCWVKVKIILLLIPIYRWINKERGSHAGHLAFTKNCFCLKLQKDFFYILFPKQNLKKIWIFSPPCLLGANAHVTLLEKGHSVPTKVNCILLQ